MHQTEVKSTYRALDMLRAHAPRRGGREPFWRPTPAPIADQVWEPRWTWRLPLTSTDTLPIHQPVETLDANGLFLAAICSVEVAHGALSHTRRRRFDRAVPGYWLVDWAPWPDDRIVSPLGSRTPQDRVWLTTPTVTLLDQLGADGLWPRVNVHDSWTTPDRCRLRTWGERMRDDRSRALAHADPQLLAAVKLGYSTAVTLMGTPGKHTFVSRPDWAQHIRAQASASVWRRAYACVSAGIVVLGMGQVDELTLSRRDTVRLRRSSTGPLVIDQQGRALGTWKGKRIDAWSSWVAA